MTTCLAKSCSFGLLCVSFVNVYQILCASSYPFGIEGGIWDVIVLIPAHCLFYLFLFRFMSHHYLGFFVCF